MAVLIVELDGRRRAAELRGRVIIGRRSSSHIVIPDRSVSRIHAWIGRADGEFFLVDSGTRLGTTLNGTAVTGRRTLSDGDEIRIGPLRMTYRSDGPPPADAEPLDLSDRPASSDDGIFVDCSCGAPLWAPWDFAGRMGQCRYCGQTVSMPRPRGHVEPSDPSAQTLTPGTPAIVVAPAEAAASRAPVAQPPRVTTAETICGACQSPIGVLEPSTRCPDCGVSFHAGCWEENRGCSSYGCRQVGILDPQPEEPEPIDAAPADIPGDEAPPAVEWEYPLLVIAMAAALAGLPAFGIPSLLTAGGLAIWRHKRPSVAHRRILAAAWIISFVGIPAGAALSWYWWFGGAIPT